MCLYPLDKMEWLSVRINILLNYSHSFNHADVPQHFLCDVVLNTFYLINHMSYLILENKISHSILFPHEYLHHLPLQVFGLHALFTIFSRYDKLSMSHKCVFFRIH